MNDAGRTSDDLRFLLVSEAIEAREAVVISALLALGRYFPFVT